MANATYIVMIFLSRRADLSPDEFHDYYENHHVPLCLKYMTGVSRYVRHYPALAEASPAGLGFDVITELHFKDKNTFEMVLEYGSKAKLPAEVIADEERLFDRSKTRYAAVTDRKTALPA